MTFLLPLIGLIAGILASAEIPNPLWIPAVIGIALLLHYFILKKSRNPVDALKYNRLHKLWIAGLFFGVGLTVAWINLPYKLKDNDTSRYIIARGEVISSVSRNAGDCHYVKVTSLTDSLGDTHKCRNLNIYLSTDGFSANTGDIITFPARFSPITDNPNYRSNGFASRMRNTGYLYKATAGVDEITISGNHGCVKAMAAASRDVIASKIEKSSLSRPSAEFTIATLLGDRSLVAQEVRETFSNGGAAHILALSGMHVAIIMGLIIFMLFPLKLILPRNSVRYIAIILIWIYAFFSGLASSTIRACIMATFIVVALSIERKNASLNALLGSAFIILIANPCNLYDVGMQLSFSCVAGIIIFSDIFNNVDHHSHPRLYKINSALLVCLIATGCTWVLTAHYFNTFPLLFLPVNFVIIPLFTPYVCLALIFVALLLLGLDCTLISGILNTAYDIISNLITLLSDGGDAIMKLSVGTPSVFLWLLGIFGVALTLRFKLPKYYAYAGAMMMASSILTIIFNTMHQPDTIIFQDFRSSISMVCYSRHTEGTNEMPDNSISMLKFSNHKIICVDTGCDSVDFSNHISSSHGEKLIVIVGKNADAGNIFTLFRRRDIYKIILHSSLEEDMEQLILKEAIIRKFPEIHSLKEGPLTLEL